MHTCERNCAITSTASVAPSPRPVAPSAAAVSALRPAAWGPVDRTCRTRIDSLSQGLTRSGGARVRGLTTWRVCAWLAWNRTRRAAGCGRATTPFNTPICRGKSRVTRCPPGHGDRGLPRS
jgi:hypothetical protein